MKHMRNGDYDVTFYAIDHDYNREGEKWVQSTFVDGIDESGIPVDDRFSALGEVYQKCGFHGTKNRGYAMRVANDLAVKYPQHRFRVVKRTLRRSSLGVYDPPGLSIPKGERWWKLENALVFTFTDQGILVCCWVFNPASYAYNHREHLMFKIGDLRVNKDGIFVSHEALKEHVLRLNLPVFATEVMI